MNFYLDRDREHRMVEAREIMDEAGAIVSVGDMELFNQLRGRFEIQAENGTIHVFFTLSPERDPKVQRLDLRFEAR